MSDEDRQGQSHGEVKNENHLKRVMLPAIYQPKSDYTDDTTKLGRKILDILGYFFFFFFLFH